jgi:hypothetical protein
MKAERYLSVLLCISTLTACQSGWVRLDGSQPGGDELARARANCKVDEKLAALESFGASVDGAANSNEARMLRIENYDAERARVDREIDACMQNAGLRKP